MTLKDLSEVSETFLMFVYREQLRVVNTIVSQTLYEYGVHCQEHPRECLAFLSGYVGRLKAAAEMLDELANGIVQVKKQQTFLAATKAASEKLEKMDNE